MLQASFITAVHTACTVSTSRFFWFFTSTEVFSSWDMTSVAVFMPSALSKEREPADSPTWKHRIFSSALIASTCCSTLSSTVLSWICKVFFLITFQSLIYLVVGVKVSLDCPRVRIHHRADT